MSGPIGDFIYYLESHLGIPYVFIIITLTFFTFLSIAIDYVLLERKKMALFVEVMKSTNSPRIPTSTFNQKFNEKNGKKFLPPPINDSIESDIPHRDGEGFLIQVTTSSNGREALYVYPENSDDVPPRFQVKVFPLIEDVFEQHK